MNISWENTYVSALRNNMIIIDKTRCLFHEYLLALHICILNNYIVGLCIWSLKQLLPEGAFFSFQVLLFSCIGAKSLWLNFLLQHTIKSLLFVETWNEAPPYHLSPVAFELGGQYEYNFEIFVVHIFWNTKVRTTQNGIQTGISQKCSILQNWK